MQLQYDLFKNKRYQGVTLMNNQECKTMALRAYDQTLQEETLTLISQFWQSHSQYLPDLQETKQDLAAWTSPGNQLYLVIHRACLIGFVHLGSRGSAIDWLDHLFILPAYQGRGLGSAVIQEVEDIVKTYSESLYIEAAARNTRAIALYHRLGYACLNTVTIRKDFKPADFTVLDEEKLYGLSFEIKRKKEA